MPQKKKFYAVKNGRKTGIFTSWAECKAQIDAFSGAVYKGFATEEEALAYMGAAGTSGKSSAAASDDESLTELIKSNPDTAVAYVDGSFKQSTGEYSCGAVLFYKGRAFQFSRKFNDSEMTEMRNVAGEIMGSVCVIQYCLKNSIDKLIIFHDYEGVARWATGDWKATKKGTQDYRSFCLEASKQIDLSFRKVKGHSGDKYNDMVDKLAKKALGIV